MCRDSRRGRSNAKRIRRTEGDSAKEESQISCIFRVLQNSTCSVHNPQDLCRLPSVTAGGQIDLVSSISRLQGINTVQGIKKNSRLALTGELRGFSERCQVKNGAAMWLQNAYACRQGSSVGEHVNLCAVPSTTTVFLPLTRSECSSTVHVTSSPPIRWCIQVSGTGKFFCSFGVTAPRVSYVRSIPARFCGV